MASKINDKYKKLVRMLVPVPNSDKTVVVLDECGQDKDSKEYFDYIHSYIFNTSVVSGFKVGDYVAITYGFNSKKPAGIRHD